MTCSPRPWWLLAALLLLPAPGFAQIGVESIFRDLTDAHFFVSCWTPSNSFLASAENCPLGANGFGLEVSFDLAEIPLREGVPGHTEWRATGKQVEFGEEEDSVVTYELVHTPPQPAVFLLIEMSLGYSQTSGFEAADPLLDLRGAVRELPGLSLYGSLGFHPTYAESIPGIGGWLARWASPYAGFRTGLITLADVQLYDDAATADGADVWSASGQSFQMGALGGLSVGSDDFSVFLEYAHMYRKLPSVEWSGPADALPARIPRTLDFSGSAFSAGLQVRVR